MYKGKTTQIKEGNQMSFDNFLALIGISVVAYLSSIEKPKALILISEFKSIKNMEKIYI